MATRHEYAPVTPLEDPTNSFVEIASALIHDCIERHQGRGALISLSIQNADLPQRYQCLSQLAELRDQIFDGRELRHVLHWVAEEWNGRGRKGKEGRFHLRFSEFVREVRQSLALGDSVALCGHQDRIRAFLDVPQGGPNDGLNALLHGRRNHGNILPWLVSLDEDNLLTPGHREDSDVEELIMARDVICGILPGPSILTFEIAVRKFFVPLLVTRDMNKLFRERPELGQLCERVAFGERDVALDEARRVLREVVQEAPNSQPQPQSSTRRCHAESPSYPPPASSPFPPGYQYQPHLFPTTPFDPDHPPPVPSPFIPPEPQSSSHSQTGRFTYWV